MLDVFIIAFLVLLLLLVCIEYRHAKELEDVQRDIDLERFANLPDPTEFQTNWTDIEYAIGKLVENGVDPTMERAERFLEHEKEKRQREEEIRQRVDRELHNPFMRPLARDLIAEQARRDAELYG